MDNREELKQRIKNAERELAGMKELLDQPVWNALNIDIGDIFREKIGYNHYVILNKDNRFYLGGLLGNPLVIFGTFGKDGATQKELIDYLNEHNAQKIGTLTTNFNSLGD